MTHMDVDWCIGCLQAFGARGPRFNPTPKPRMAFIRCFHLSLLSDNGLKSLFYLKKPTNKKYILSTIGVVKRVIKYVNY
jgi:hypothetical protein